MTRLPDHDLSVLVETAAEGATNSWAAHSGGTQWKDLTAGQKNLVRETALPFLFHGTKALAELGYRKTRAITTAEELDSLPVGAVVLSDAYRYQVHGGADCGWPVAFQRWSGGDWHRGARGLSTHPDNFLPVTVLHEAMA